MARDYKRKRQTKKSSAGSPWKFLLSGFGLGLVAAFLMYFYLKPVDPNTPIPNVASTPQSIAEADKEVAIEKPVVAEPAKTKTAKATNPESVLPEPGEEDYQFYTMLPDFEVVVSDGDNQSDSNGSAATVPNTQTNVSSVPATFILQAGSFKKFTDADRRKAELAFKGLESNIQQVVLNKDQIWYRVYVGPSKNLANLEDVRSTLRKADIDAFLVRVKQ